MSNASPSPPRSSARAESPNGVSRHRWFEGTIVLEYGQPSADLTLRLYRVDFGGTAEQVAEATTDSKGRYQLPIPAEGDSVSFQVRAVRGGRKEVSLTDTFHDTGDGEFVELNLVGPAELQPLAGEFRRLTRDLKTHVGKITNLASAREDGQRQDLTLLNRATGWDARVIALAASAAALAAKDRTGLPAEALYGMLRAGLPADPKLLAHVSGKTVVRTLDKARKAGIIDLDREQIQQVQDSFQRFSDAARMSERAPGSTASYNDLLKNSGVGKPGQERFAAIYMNHKGSDDELWQATRSAGVSEKEIQVLQRQGKLAFLTFNNTAVVERLQKKLGVSDPKELIDHDFHEAGRWKTEIKSLAGRSPKALAALIPPAYEGKKVESRLNLYAQDMARKLRVSYPTQVVARMVETDSRDIFGSGETRAETVKLLKSAADDGFRLGETPVEAFFRDNIELRGGLSSERFAVVQEQLKTLQRVYQITPSDGAMSTLIELGMDSAYDVIAVSEDEFVGRYEKQFANSQEARSIHQKASQVGTVTYNIFTIAKKLESDVPVAGISGSAEQQESVRNELIKHFPTLESLFGSMDYCECEHCRSVLSPAAYLVDLLQFIDQRPAVWASFLTKWRSDHNNQSYPHAENGQALTPYDVLIRRRPDIPFVELTCENTKTALPYIDVVNEILEYYVAHNGLTQQAARDTGSATTAELLAEPQNVIAEAYNLLRQAIYPVTLPFDLWHEMVRSFCNHFEVPLSEVLKAFRRSEALFAPAQSFDRSHEFIESLGLSRAEADIFTNPNPLPNWFRLYGFTTSSAAVTVATDAATGQRIDLNSAKALSRRLGITYKQLVELIQTTFVNPQLADLVILNKLGVTTEGVLFYEDNKTFFDRNEDLIGSDRATLSSADKTRFDALAADDWTKLGKVEAFELRLDQLTAANATTGFDAKAWLTAELQAGRFDKVLLLADPDTGSNFDLTTMQYADGTAADAIAFLRLNLFVRLWRKLGWTIEETDRALQAFIPRDAPFTAANMNKAPLLTALIYMSHLKALEGRVKVGKQARLKLITLWSQIATRGRNPLYAQLFLTKGVLGSDKVFDDPLGNYISPAGLTAMAAAQTFEVVQASVARVNKLDPAAFTGEAKVSVTYDDAQNLQRLSYRGILSNTEKARIAVLSTSPALAPLLDAVQAKGEQFKLVRGHALALQGALGLTTTEIAAILEDAGFDPATAPLSLDTVSLLYRYGLLAKALKLPVTDLIALRQLSGLDPFQPLASGVLAQISEDHPFTQTLAFVEIAEQVKQSGVKIDDLQYLLRHRFDPKGKYRPDTEATLALLKTLAAGVAAIRAEHGVPAEPGMLSDEVMQQKLNLVLPAEIATTLLAMRAGTAEFTATKTAVQAADRLRPEAFSDEPAITALSYNATRQEQKLSFRGVLFDQHKSDLKAQLPKPSGNAAFAASEVFGDLIDQVQAQPLAFFNKYLLRQAPGFEPATGFLAAADFEFLFGPAPNNLSQAQRQARDRRQRARLEEAFLPFLQERLIHRFVIDIVGAELGAEPDLVEALLTDGDLLTDPPPVETLIGAGARGVTATFLSGTGAQLASAQLDDAFTGLTDDAGIVIKPANTAGVRVHGYLEVPATGAYRFYALLDAAAAATELRFDHLPDALFAGIAAANAAEISEFIELKAGVLYGFTFTATKLAGGNARLLVQGEALPKDPLTQLTLYPRATIDAAARALTLLRKALQLTDAIELSERELRYLLTHAGDFGNLDLGGLPTRVEDDTPAAATALFNQFLRLVAYARLKSELAPAPADLIEIFEASAIEIDRAYELIAKLTRRRPSTVIATAKALTAAPSFPNEQSLQRLWDSLQIVERFGVPVESLISWTEIVSPNASSDRRFRIASDLKQALKARFEPEAWQRVAQPIFDKLRQRQRDALVAQVMHRHGFDRQEQLFEYFLIDPGMEPVVQTSRIRLAISSLQLFIQRSLLNLEAKVEPATINSRQWESMKRFRVWEANRKIFLYPENWLEPEFRDDKTHLFTELEGKMSQGDVSADLVEDAFLNYLRKLEELARLNIVAMHIEDKTDPADNVLHVIGRTYSEPHKYFYRRYAHQMWTPWEPVTADIEGDHLAPVIWRDRLYLFWVTFLEKSETPKGGGSGEPKLTELKVSDLHAATKVVTVEAHLHWSEYLDGQWSTRESAGPVSPTPVIRRHIVDWDPYEVFVHVSKEPREDGQERGVYIHMSGAIDRAFYLAGRNSTPEKATYGGEPNHYVGPPSFPFYHDNDKVTSYRDHGDMRVYFAPQVVTVNGLKSRVSKESMEILERAYSANGRYELLPADNDINFATDDIAELIKPVFYQDSKTTMYVQPNVVETTTEAWTGWIAKNPGIVFEFEEPELENFLEELIIVPEIPRKEVPIPRPGGDPVFHLEISPESPFTVNAGKDWLLNPVTTYLHDGALIGATGATGVVVLTAGDAPAAIEGGGVPLKVHSGSDIAGGSVAVNTKGGLNQNGFAKVSGGINVVGSGGVSTGLIRNLERQGLSGAAQGVAAGAPEL